MQKFIPLLLATTLSLPVFAQGTNETKDDFKKNHVKLNLFALPLRNFSLQYERGLNKDMAVALGASFLPKGSIPFQGTIRNAIDAEEGDAGLDLVNNAKVSSWSLTPEFRYYFGRKPLNGFYLAPFIRVGAYNIDWQYKYEKSDGSEKPVDLKGRSGMFSAGLLIGAQWHLGQRILLDWWILGPQYGSNNIKLEASGDFSDLTKSEQADLEGIIEKISYNGNRFEATVTDNSVKADNKISLPGLRTGFCIGFKF